MDISPHGRFAPWAIRPSTFRPIDVSPHTTFRPKAIRPWGETSSVRRNVDGANRPWGEKSIHGAKHPWGELSAGRKVYKPREVVFYREAQVLSQIQGSLPLHHHDSRVKSATIEYLNGDVEHQACALVVTSHISRTVDMAWNSQRSCDTTACRPRLSNRNSKRVSPGNVEHHQAPL